MTKRIFMIIALFMSSVLFIHSQPAQQTPTTPTKANTGKELAAQGHKRYAAKSGIVEYKLEGMQKGTETLYFDNWGWREARYTQSEIALSGVTQKLNRITILDGYTTISIDLTSKTGTKMEMPILRNIVEKSEGKNLEEVGARLMIDMGGEKIGTEQFLGKTCDVWEVKNMKTKSWIWKAITLKLEMNMAGMSMQTIATKIETDVVVSEDKFAVPKDVKITESGPMPVFPPKGK